MDTNDLKAFVAVAESQSFSLAAKQLFLTQPAISKRIASLEQRVNHALFDRMGRQVVLTEAGQTLFPKAQLILQTIIESEREIRELSGEIVGNLRVATSHHIGLHHLPPILRQFAVQHSNVNLQFDFLDSEKAHEKVLSGACELAIVTLPPKLELPLTSETLWDDPLVFVVGENHHLAKRKKITLHELAKEAAILPDLNTFTGRMAKQCFDDAKETLKINMATNYLETIKMMVSVGLGWSLLPKTLVDNQLIILNVENMTPIRYLGIIRHSKKSLSNAALAFYNVLCEKAH